MERYDASNLVRLSFQYDNAPMRRLDECVSDITNRLIGVTCYCNLNIGNIPMIED